MVISTRAGNESDIPWLIAEARKFTSLYQQKTKAFVDDEYAFGFFQELVTNHFVSISETDDEAPTGFVAAYLVPHPFNPKVTTLCEIFYWVREEYQTGRSALLLLKDLNAYGDKHADIVSISRMSKSRLTPRTLERHGFEQLEENYMRETS